MDNATAYTIIKKYAGKINPFGALCQCNWETRTAGKAWSSELFKQANNAAGIKRGGSWGGKIYKKASWEQRADGTKYTQESEFRAYNSFEEFVSDYANKIEKMYPHCAKDNFFGYFAGLYKGIYGSWATDQHYFERLCAVAFELAPEVFGNGEMWRNKMLESFDYAMEKGYLTKGQGVVVLGMLKEKMGTMKMPAIEVRHASHVICLDAGHGGTDSGASAGGYAEKDIALKIVQRTGAELIRRGYDVHYTRAVDEYVARPERARIANGIPAELFLSIHLNAATNTSARGHEDWISKRASNASAKLASLIGRHWSKMFPNTVQRGTKLKDYDVLALTKMPAVLSEVCFISNAEERALAISDMYRETVASIYANAIDDLFAEGMM